MKLKALMDIVGGEKHLIKVGETFEEPNNVRANFLIKVGKAEKLRPFENLEKKSKK